MINEVKCYNDWNVDELMYIDISWEKYYDLNCDDYCVEVVYFLEEIVMCVL